MYRYELAFTLENCPKAWKNLIRDNQINPGVPVDRDRIASILDQYNVIEIDYYGDTQPESYHCPSVIFESEEDATAFTLKWS
jgi:hypothetical protein